MKMKKKYTGLMVVGALLVLSGLLLKILSPPGGTPLVATGVVLIAVAALRHRQIGEGPEKDERTRKLGAYGAAYSWLLTLLLMFALFWADYLGLLTISAREVLLITILFTGLSAGLFQWYLLQKGDL